jgi:hypothetical protein
MAHRLIAIDATTALKISRVAKRRGRSIKALATSIINAYLRRNERAARKGGQHD